MTDLYIYRKTHKLCVACGKRDARTASGKVTCESCTAKRTRTAAAREHRMKSESRCIRCGAQDEYTKSGRSLCMECASEQSEKALARQYHRKRNRLCTECGKPLPAGYFFVMCEPCRERLKELKRRRGKRSESPACKEA